MTTSRFSLLFLMLFGTVYQQPGWTADGPVEEILWLPSRGIEIPATLLIPLTGDQAQPLVLMAHGHGGSRDEAGGFSRLAAMLAAEGIASVRMDFPGCGESRESLRENTIDHMLSDLRAVRDYALARPEVDSARIGLLGYSMGGRVAMLSVADDIPYAALAIWAPAASDDASDFYAFMGGVDGYNSYRETASRDGFAIITTPWGQLQELSLGWFTGLEQSQPMTAIANYHGPLLVLHGAADEIIPLSHSETISRLLPQTQRQVIESAGHGLGFYDEDPVTADQILRLTSEFFVSKLAQR